jgi:hypothetical protein
MMAETLQSASGYQRYYGKYRAKVLDNVDPLGLGRILPEVAAFRGSMLNWAMPCVPYAGADVGFYAIPPIGANVWIEFEGGDPNYPIWSGCFWDEGEVPLEPPVPERKVFKTEFITMILNDIPEEGGFTLECIPEAVQTPLKMIFNSQGIEINADPAIIRMVPEEGITITFPPGSIAMTEEDITVSIPESTLTMTEESVTVNGTDITIAATGAAEVTAGGNLTLDAGAALEVSAGADASMEAGGGVEISAGADASMEAGGATEVSGGGDVSISAGGIVDMQAIGDASITALAMEITAAGIAMTGAVEVTGDLLIDGQQPLVI